MATAIMSHGATTVAELVTREPVSAPGYGWR
jgi:hypothetical protein